MMGLITLGLIAMLIALILFIEQKRQKAEIKKVEELPDYESHGLSNTPPH